MIPAGLYIEIPEACPDKDFALGDEENPVSLEIKWRGNATWLMPKKPYKLKFSKKTAILGMPKQKHFALLACYGNPIGWGGTVGGMELARLAGLPWTPGVEPVELVLNGTYEGLYFLFESISHRPRHRRALDRLYRAPLTGPVLHSARNNVRPRRVQRQRVPLQGHRG